MTLPPARAKQLARVLRLGLGAAVLGYGLYIAEPAAPRLMIFGLALYALPLLFQLSRWPLARAYALWFGVFLVLQSLMAPLLRDAPYLVLHRPNTTATVTYAEGALAGITGTHRVTYDERGFRTHPRVDYDRKAGVRIFAIGGSSTEEQFIDDEATWTHRLQVALATELAEPIEVINAGVRGLRARHHAAMLGHILPLQPDLVLFLVGFNDWHFDTTSRFGSERPAQRLVFPDTPLGRVARFQYDRMFRPAPQVNAEQKIVTTRPLPGGALRRAQKISWFPEIASDQYLGRLARISDICRARTLTCVFITQPTAYVQDAPEELTDLFWASPAYTSYTLTLDSLVHIARLYNRALIDFAKKRGHPVCDLAAQLNPTIQYFFDDVHFTLAGSARVAELLTGCVKHTVAAMHESGNPAMLKILNLKVTRDLELD